jgi:tetratricopeptide (TPR) repeat protein
MATSELPGSLPDQLESLETTFVRVNTRLVVIALALLGLVVGAGVISRHLFMTRATRGLRENARRLYASDESKQKQQGLRDLSRYVQLIPGDVEAKLELANWMLESFPEGEAGEAALQHMADYYRVRSEDRATGRRLIELALRLGRTAEITGNLTPELEAEIEKDAQLSALMGLCLVEENRADEGAKRLVASINLSPETPSYYRTLLAIIMNESYSLGGLDALYASLAKPGDAGTDVKSGELGAQQARTANGGSREPGSTESGAGGTGASRNGASSAGSGASSAASAEGDLEEDRPLISREMLVERLFDRMQSSVRPISEYRVLHSEYLLQRGRIEDAERMIELGLIQYGNDEAVLMQAILVKEAAVQMLYGWEGRDEANPPLEQALSLALRGVEVSPQSLRMREVLARLYMRLERFDDAVAAFRGGLEEVESQAEAGLLPDIAVYRGVRFLFQWGLANALILRDYLETGRITGGVADELRQIRESFELNKVRRPLIDYLEGRQLMVQQEWREAQNLFEKARGQLTTEREAIRGVDLALAETADRLENPDEVVRLLTRGLSQDPGWQSGRILRAEALSRLGLDEEALEEFRRIIDLGQVPLRLLRLMVRAQLKRAKSYRSWRDIEVALGNLEQSMPSDLSVQALRAEVLFHQEQFEASDRMLEKVTSENPMTLELAETHMRVNLNRTDIPEQERVDRAERALLRYGQVASDDVDLRLLRGELLTTTNRPGRGEELYQLTVRNEESVGGEDSREKYTESQVRLLMGLAALCNSAGMRTEAERFWREALDLEPANTALLLVLGDSAVGENQLDDARRYLAKLRSIEGEGGANGNFLEALILSRPFPLEQVARDKLDLKESETLGQIRELLVETVRKRPSWIDGRRLAGLVAWRLGKEDEAFQHLNRALDLGDRSSVPQLIVCEYLYERNRDEDLLDLVTQLERFTQAKIPDSVRRAGAMSAVRLRMWDSAINRAGPESNDDDPQQATAQDLLLKAYVKMLRAGTQDAERDEVAQLLGQATERDPSLGFAWILRVSFLHQRWLQLQPRSFVERSDPSLTEDPSLAVIEEAAEKIPGTPASGRLVTLALCHEARGNLPDAERSFVQARATDASNIEAAVEHVNYLVRQGYSERALELLTDLLANSRKIPREQQTRLVRLKARLTAATTRRYGEFQEAMEVLGDSIDIDLTDTEDLRAQLYVLSRSTIRQDLLRRALILQVLVRRGATTNSEIIEMADLFNAAGRWTEALGWYRVLLNKEPRNPDFQVAFLRSALEQPKLAENQPLFREIENSLGILEQVEPGGFRPTAMRIRFHVKLGERDQVTAVSESFLEKLPTRQATDVARDLANEQRLVYVLDALQNAEPPPSEADNTAINELRSTLVARLEAASEQSQLLLASAPARQLMTAELAGLLAPDLEEIGELAVAERLFTQFAEQGGDPKAPLFLAAFHARRGEVSRALTIFNETAGRVDPVLRSRSLVSCLRVGRASAAQVEYARARLQELLTDASTPMQRSDLLISVADLEVQHGQNQRALEIYQEILAIDPENATVSNNMAWILAFDPNRLPEARERAQKALELVGPAAEVLDTLAVIHLQSREYNEALQLLRQTLEAPTRWIRFYWMHMAVAQFESNDLNQAREALEKARNAGFRETEMSTLEATRFGPVIEQIRANLTEEATPAT